MSERPSLVQRALGGHAALGLLSGALMYVIVLSGTLAVVGPRLDRWEQPGAPEMTELAPMIAQRVIESGLRASASPPAVISITPPSDAQPRATLTADGPIVYIRADGTLGPPVRHSWSDFVLALHEYLTLPSTIGLLLVGALGSMLAALAITGVVAHPRIFRDAFRLRPRGNRQLAQADWHNRLAVWTLPFSLAIALTGAFLGLAALSAQVIADRYHGGDLSAVYKPVFGDQTSPGGAPAPVADVARALKTMRARLPDANPTYIGITAPGTVGQRVQIIAELPRRLIYGESYRFDGAGRYLGHVGLSDGALGQQVAASTYKLHFGNFGGPIVELAYVLLGFALTAITGTGMSLWLQKRRRRGAASPRLEAFWAVMVWGVPIAMTGVCWVSLLGAGSAVVAAFWLGLTIMTIAGVAAPGFAEPRRLRMVLALMLGLTGVGHAIWSGASGLAIDGALIAIAVVLVAIDRRR